MRRLQFLSAERQGFEPWVPVRVQRFSRPSRSTTPASFLLLRLYEEDPYRPSPFRSAKLVLLSELYKLLFLFISPELIRLSIFELIQRRGKHKCIRRQYIKPIDFLQLPLFAHNGAGLGIATATIETRSSRIG